MPASRAAISCGLLRSLAYGTFAWFGVYLVFSYGLPSAGSIHSGWLKNDFASRATGACGGWTHEMAASDFYADLVTGWAYTAIPVGMAMFHPTRPPAFSSGPTIWLSMGFITTCGIVHTAMGVTNYNPAYNTLLGLKWLNAAMSAPAAVAIPLALMLVAREVEMKLLEARSKLEK